MGMRRLVLILGVLGALLLVVSACGDDDTATSGGSDVWGRTFVTDGPPPLRVGFTDDHQVTAVAECNHLSANARIEDGVLTVDAMGGTEMGCDPDRHAYDEFLASFFQSSPTVALDGPMLTLTSGADTLVLTDREVADPDRPLTGTRWVVDGLIDGDSVSSMPAGAQEAFVVFSPGRVEGKTGCNSFGADTTVDGDRIEVQELVTTDVACGDVVMAVEQAMYAALHGTVTYEIDASRLTLHGPDGHGLLLLADE
jgi:heat shock protein HslJ